MQSVAWSRQALLDSGLRSTSNHVPALALLVSHNAIFCRANEYTSKPSVHPCLRTDLGTERRRVVYCTCSYRCNSGRGEAGG